MFTDSFASTLLLCTFGIILIWRIISEWMGSPVSLRWEGERSNLLMGGREYFHGRGLAPLASLPPADWGPLLKLCTFSCLSAPGGTKRALCVRMHVKCPFSFLPFSSQGRSLKFFSYQGFILPSLLQWHHFLFRLPHNIVLQSPTLAQLHFPPSLLWYDQI